MDEHGIVSATQGSEFTCITRSEKKKTTIKWVISNFSLLCPGQDKFVTSSQFPKDDSYNTKWYMDLYPRGNEEENKDHIAIYLYYFSGPAASIEASYKLAFLDHEGWEIRCTNFQKIRTFNIKKGWGSSNFLRRSELMKNKDIYLPNDELTVLCEVTWLQGLTTFLQDGFSHEDNFINYPKMNIHPPDLVIKCGNRMIPVHKCILSVRSKTFKKMLMDDPLCTTIEMEDFGCELLYHILSFIYKDVLDYIEDEKVYEELLVASYDYEIGSLSTLCEVELAKRLNLGNALEFLHLANTYKAEHLKRSSIRLLNSTRVDDVADKDMWKLLEVENKHDSTTDVFSLIANKSKGLKRKYNSIEENQDE